MPTFGRRDNPTEHDLGDVVGQRHVLNRTIRAQVRSVDAENGFVILIYENMPGGGKYTTVKPLWMSFPDAKIGNPAWGRFIPQEGDLVRVSFDYDDRPIIVGFDIAAESAKIADGLSGWPALNEQYKNARGPDAPASKAKFAQFTPLKPGEYDFMSSGGAYIYGSNQGRLYLAGGNVSIALIKNDLRISARSQLYSHSADDCELRFGQVRRTNPSSQLDEKVAADTNGQFKEFSVVLKKTIEAGTSSDVSTLRMGNVVDDSGTVLGSNPYRYMYQAFIDAGDEALKMTIDNLGNWDVLAPTQATTGVMFDFSMGDWTTKFKTMTHNASEDFILNVDHDFTTTVSNNFTANVTQTASFNVDTKFVINSPTIHFQGPSGSPSATHPLFLSNTYKDAETTYANDLSTQIANLATSVATLSSALFTFGTAMGAAGSGATSLPTALAAIAAMGVAGTTLAPVGTAQSSAATTVSTQVPVVASTFVGPYSTYFSQISKTG